MNKKIILFMACLLPAIGTLSAKSLVLTLNSGMQVYYLLGEDSNPMMRFTDGRIKVNVDEYEFSDIKNFYISESDDPNGIEPTTKDVTVEHKNSIVIFNTDKPLTIKVYSANGNEEVVHTQHADGRTSVDLGTLPQGIHIITAGDTSLKVLKK